MGGWNSEKDVSLKSGEAVYQELLKMGYNAKKVIFTKNIAKDLEEIKPDIVFNALHGQYGEDGRVQGLLDILNIPYTHSGFLTSTICMNKKLTNKICEEINIKTAKSYIVKKNDNNIDEMAKKITKPYVIKPISEGSSVGVEVILEDNNFNLKDYSWQYGDEIIVEKYIKGQEIQVAFVNDKAVGALEVRPKKLFYDYECKYSEGMTDYIIPAPISDEKYQEALNLAQKIYNHFNCRSIARVEFILDENDNEFYFLEINTHPGFTSTSLVPKIAQLKNISFAEIIENLINSAKCRS